MREQLKKIILENKERKTGKTIKRDININPETKEITAITGPRRAGKTTIMLELMQKLPEKQTIFIDFEDYRLTNFNDFEEIINAFEELYGEQPKYYFLDEIQELNNWTKILRTLHNQNKKIIVSGSSSKLLSKEISTELRGRHLTKTILPFSFKEFLKAKNITITKKEIYLHKGKIQALFKEYLEYGGYPEIINRKTSQEKKELLKNYYETIFYKDIIERHKIKDTDTIQELMNHITNNPASTFSITKYHDYQKSQGKKISKKTISAHLKALEEAYYIILTEKYDHSSRKRASNPKKTYLTDNGFIQLFKTQEILGKQLENLIATQLKRQQEINYYKGVQECDFITNEKEAIQVTWQLTPENRKREINGVKEAMKTHNLKKGLIITEIQEETIGNIKIVPAWKWLLETT